MIEAMHPRRRFLAFADYLRARFGDRVQRVSLGHRLVCPWPEGPRACPFCQEARELDPNYGHGLPPHEHIRRSANFARGRGEEVRLMVMAHLPVGVSDPLDHVRSTFQLAMLQPGVVALALDLAPDQLNEELFTALSPYHSEERDVWLEVDGLPEGWPASRNGGVRVGVHVPVPPADMCATTAAEIRRLAPNAVGFIPPVILAETPEAARYQNGKLAEPSLEEFAEGAAALLERLPADIAVHPVTLPAPLEEIVGPPWVLNRQKVQEAITKALEGRGTRQGEHLS